MNKKFTKWRIATQKCHYQWMFQCYIKLTPRKPPDSWWIFFYERDHIVTTMMIIYDVPSSLMDWRVLETNCVLESGAEINCWNIILSHEASRTRVGKSCRDTNRFKFFFLPLELCHIVTFRRMVVAFVRWIMLCGDSYCWRWRRFALLIGDEPTALGWNMQHAKGYGACDCGSCNRGLTGR